MGPALLSVLTRPVGAGIPVLGTDDDGAALVGSTPAFSVKVDVPSQSWWSNRLMVTSEAPPSARMPVKVAESLSTNRMVALRPT